MQGGQDLFDESVSFRVLFIFLFEVIVFTLRFMADCSLCFDVVLA